MSDDFERRLAAADLCFKRGAQSLKRAKEWYSWGLLHIETAEAGLQSDFDGFLQTLEMPSETGRVYEDSRLEYGHRKTEKMEGRNLFQLLQSALSAIRGRK